jgi:sensor histidine kinase YesM
MSRSSPALDAKASRRTAMRALVAAFALLSVVSAVQTLLLRRNAGESGSIWATVFFSVGIWFAWLALVPAIGALGRRFDFRAGRRGQSVLVHTAAALLAHVLTMLVTVVLGVVLFTPEEAITPAMVRGAILLSSRLPISLVVYAGILGLHRAIGLLQVLADREAVAARLETQATRARLEALAARLHPHFLFNALQSASALVEREPARARTMLALIGDLLRDVLDASGTEDVPLEEELAYLGRYLAIEEVRFADRLTVAFDVEPGAARVGVPRFLLQPLAENALRHGLAPLPEGGTVRITAQCRGGQLTLVVWNDGVPLPVARREGVGLTTTRERLAARYGDTASLDLGPRDGGVAVTVVVPA